MKKDKTTIIEPKLLLFSQSSNDNIKYEENGYNNKKNDVVRTSLYNVHYKSKHSIKHTKLKNQGMKKIPTLI